MITAFFDGGCEPKNPGGVPTYGFVVYQDGEKIGEGCGVADEPFGYKATVNVAEYGGLIHLLEFLKVNGWQREKIRIVGDSQLIIRQVNGLYACRDLKLVPLCKHAGGLFSGFPEARLDWVPRGQNGEADKLAHQAYADYLDDNADARKQIKMLAPRMTEKQKDVLDRLGVKYGKYISQKRASRLIKEARRAT